MPVIIECTYDQVMEEEREMATEDYEKFMGDLNNKYILELVNSNLAVEKEGAITAIGTISYVSYPWPSCHLEVDPTTKYTYQYIQYA